MEFRINRMQASISGQAVTLAKESGGISESHPGYLDASSIVINTVANPPPADFWKLAATGVRYVVKISIET